MYNFVVFLHVVGAFVFVLAHGASAAVTFRLRGEQNLQRLGALLELSGSTLGLSGISLLVLLVAGIILGFMGGWWGTGWIWASLVLLVATSVGMMAVGKRYFNEVRKAAGLEYLESGKMIQPPGPASAEELAALLARAPAMLIAIIGLGGLVIILWLMMYKPF